MVYDRSILSIHTGNSKRETGDEEVDKDAGGHRKELAAPAGREWPRPSLNMGEEVRRVSFGSDKGNKLAKKYANCEES